MSDLNQCQFIGRLGRDVEMRYMTNGKAVASFSIAVGSQWKDKESGEKKESVEWVNITAFDKLAEICAEYLQKGSQIYVSGKFKTEKFQDKDTGADRYSTKIIADQMQMLGGKQSGQAEQKEASSPAKPAPKSTSFDDFDNDTIPF